MTWFGKYFIFYDLIVVKEFPCVSGLESCAGGNNSLPEGSPMPGWSKGRDQTKSSPPCKLGVEGTHYPWCGNPLGHHLEDVNTKIKSM